MTIRPPPSTRTYRSVYKNLDEDHFDAEYYVKRFCRSDEDYEVLWLGAILCRMYNPRYRKRSTFPSACDVIDAHLGYEGVDEEPVWESEEDRRRSIIGLFAVQRLVLFLNEQYNDNPDECMVGEELVYCPVCNQESVKAKLGYKFEFRNGVLSCTDEITMVNAKLTCKCRSLGLADVLSIREDAVEAIFQDFNT